MSPAKTHDSASCTCAGADDPAAMCAGCLMVFADTLKSLGGRRWPQIRCAGCGAPVVLTDLGLAHTCNAWLRRMIAREVALAQGETLDAVLRMAGREQRKGMGR
jgi:hypothetical protein